MDNKIGIEICGKNNEKISDAEFRITNKENINESVGNFVYGNRIVIIQKFLNKMDKKGVINTAIGFGKKGTHSLWNPNYMGNSYFGGVVGVIEDELRINMDDGDYNASEDLRQVYENKSIIVSVRLQIKSRFDTEKPYFLATMLLRDHIKLNDNIVLSSEDDLYDYMLLFWYKSKLLAAYEKGFYKTYRRFETNGERLKGSIDISRHIRLNAGQNNGKIASSYRENTVNNFLNHLIIAAYEYFKNKYPELIEQNIENDLDIKSIIECIKCEIGYSPMTSKSLIKENNKPISHPYFTEYEDLRVICIKILRDEGISIWDAEEEKTKSILFYIPDLWEAYLEDKLKEYKEIMSDIYTQGKNPDGDDAIRVFGNVKAKDNKEFVQPTYPDFVFFDGKNPYFVLDAKFRKGWVSSIATEDKDSRLYDWGDYNKCIRDMNSVNAHATGVIFPTNILPDEGKTYFSEESICHRISYYNGQDMFYTFPVIVPPVFVSTDKETDKGEVRNYTDWKKEFDECVKSAIDEVRKKVSLEKKYAIRIREYMQGIPKRENM